MTRILRWLGRAAIKRARAIYDVWSIIMTSLGGFVTAPGRGGTATRSVFLRQIYLTSFEALPLISWLALILGFIVVTQSLSLLPRFGAEGLLGEVLVWVVVREAGPLFASVIVIARSGTAIASELGSMKISREITAIEVMGIDPMRYLIAPRVLGTAVSVFVLTFYFEAVSLFGAYLLAGFGKSMTFGVYAESVLEAMGWRELIGSVVKSAVFGLIIGAVCSGHGLKVGRSITQIPQQTTMAVMASLGLVFVADAFITFVLYI